VILREEVNVDWDWSFTFPILPLIIVALGIIVGINRRGKVAPGYGDKLAFIIACLLLIYFVFTLVYWITFEPSGTSLDMYKAFGPIIILPFIILLPLLAGYYGIKGFKKRTNEKDKRDDT
jgi:hypothetical protein